LIRTNTSRSRFVSREIGPCPELCRKNIYGSGWQLTFLDLLHYIDIGDMRSFFAASLLLFVASGVLLAQQSQAVPLQERLSTSDSVQATVISLSGDIRAGESFEFTVTLDRAPSFLGGRVGFNVSKPDGGFGDSCAEGQEAPQHRVYHCTIRVPQMGPGGIWTIQHIYLYEGVTQVELSSKSINFKVTPDPHLILPTSAEVTVNLDQKQLLRREAGRLQGRIQQLKSTVSEYAHANAQGGIKPILRQDLVAAEDALKTTEAEFSKLATVEGQQANAKVFFDDLRQSYERVISHLGTFRSAFGAQGRLVLVADTDKYGTEPLLALALRPMEQNELAYTVVADGGSLTFDLEVDSTPEGATVSYFRKGDSPRVNPDETRTIIPKLPYAIWTVRFDKPGYKTEEREHDPFREPNHVVHVNLEK